MDYYLVTTPAEIEQAAAFAGEVLVSWSRTGRLPGRTVIACSGQAADVEAPIGDQAAPGRVPVTERPERFSNRFSGGKSGRSAVI
jgi:hypothetical protein